MLIDCRYYIIAPFLYYIRLTGKSFKKSEKKEKIVEGLAWKLHII